MATRKTPHIVKAKVINFKPSPLQPKQADIARLLLQDTYDNDGRPTNTRIGIGGARGGGKSHVGDDVLLGIALSKRNIRVLVFRRLYKQLLKVHIRPMLERHPWLDAYYLKSEETALLPNGSTFTFGHAENPSDIEKFRGDGYDYIFIDDCSEDTQEMIEFLYTCLRSTGETAVPKMLMSFNPGGLCHKYLKSVFVDRKYKENERASMFIFVRAYLWDNVEWVRKQLEEDGYLIQDYYRWTEEERRNYSLRRAPYAQELLSLPKHRRDSELFGRFDTHAGQFFDAFHSSIHVIEPFVIDPEWTLVMATDHGNVTSTQVVARDGEGNIYVIGELHQEKTEQNPMATPEKAGNLRRWLDDEEYWDDIGLKNMREVFHLGDTNMFSQEVGSDLIPSNIFASCGIFLTKVTKNSEKHTKYRIVANDALQGLLAWKQDDEGRMIIAPKLFFFKGRTKSICETLPNLMVNPANPRDFLHDSGEDDHDTDALKYAVMNIFTPTLQPRFSHVIMSMTEEMSEYKQLDDVSLTPDFAY